MELSENHSLFKTCKLCNEKKPLQRFRVDRTMLLGRKSECKSCSSKAWKKYYENNKDKRLNNSRNYRARKNMAYGKITKGSVDLLIKYFGDSCCNVDCNNDYEHIDHVKALANGGSNYIYNLQLLCSNCNLVKGTNYIDYRKNNNSILEFFKEIYIMNSKLGIHVTTGPRNNYGEFVSSKPAVVMAVNVPGAFDEVSGNTIKIYRQQDTYGDMYPDFDQLSLEEQAGAAEYWFPQLMADWDHIDAHYFQPTNEIAGYNDEVSLKKLCAYEERLMELAAKEGIKLAVGSFAGGSPNFELWKKIVVPFLRKAKALGHIYNRHVYGGVSTDYPWLMRGGDYANDNVRRPELEAQYLDTQGIRIPIVLTEVGNHAGLRNGNAEESAQDIISYSIKVGKNDLIVGVAAFTVGDYLECNLQESLPYMSIYNRANPSDGIQLIYELEENNGDNPVELLPNNNFESGHYHGNGVPELQLPNGYSFIWGEGYNPVDSNEWSNFVRPEVRVLPENQLPPHERHDGDEPLVISPDHTIKIFKGHGSIHWALYTVVSLDPGTYNFTTPLYFDGVVNYDEHGNKIPSNDPEGLDCRVVVLAKPTSDFTFDIDSADFDFEQSINLDSLFWTSVTTEFEVEMRQSFVLGVQVMQPYALVENGMFTDDWSLTKVSEDISEECLPKHLHKEAEANRAINFNMDAALEKEIYAHGFTPFQSEQRTTYDGVRYAYQGARQLGSNNVRVYYCVVGEWGNISYISYDAENKEPPSCVGGGCPDDMIFHFLPTTCKTFTQWFGQNPLWYARFNLPGHSGVDIACEENSPIRAAVYGTVSTVANDVNGYGRYCRIKTANGKYWVYYGHMNTIVVSPNDTVEPTTIIGYMGSTGNSTGPHLHLEVRAVSGEGEPGWPKGIINIDDCVKNLDPYFEAEDETIDLAHYIFGDGSIYMLQNANGGQEKVQFQYDDSEDAYYQVKNSQWEKFELDNNYIYRTVDTSPGNNRFYKITNSSGGPRPFTKRFVRVGDRFTFNGHVQFYNKDTCEQSQPNSGFVSDTIEVVDYYDLYTFPTGVAVEDVVVLKWVNGGELYYYALDLGLVGWAREHQDPNTPQWSFISNFVNQPEDLEREIICNGTNQV